MAEIRSQAVQAKRVVVVGAGIVGACCAFSLQRAGFDVMLLDKDEPGRAASYGNSGSIGLSSTPPLGVPGMLRDVPRMLLDPKHALVIRWRRLLPALPWFLKFVQTLKPERVEAISRARAALLASAGSAYDDLLSTIGQPELIYGSGLIFAYESEATFRGAGYSIGLRRRTGIEVQELDGDALRELEPAISSKATHGIFLPNVRTVTNPLRLTQAIIAAFIRAGGKVRHEQVRRFERDGNQVSSVVTDHGGHACDLAVISAGAWSRQLVRLLGDSIPLEAERGYHIMIDHPRAAPAIPVVSGDHNVSITTMDDGLRMTTMAEFAAIDAPPDHARAMRVFKAASGLIRDLEIKVASRWVGSRPSTPDSLPVIGRSPVADNVLYAFGHGHLGVTFGAVTGNLTTQLALGAKPNLDISPYRPDRPYDGSHLEGWGTKLKEKTA